MNKESELQKSCVTWFRLQYPEYSNLFFAIPNGGSRNIIEAANLKKQGVLSGVADLFLSIPNKDFHGFYIELKCGKNKQQDSQKEFEKACLGKGYKYSVVYEFEAFMKEINDYLAFKNAVTLDK